MVMLTIPPLTEERRKNLVKQVKTECENGKISIRTVRKDTNDALKKLQKEGASEDEIKRAEDTVQKYTDQYAAKIDGLFDKKEEEILKV
jgi:ribosome recycling factor